MSVEEILEAQRVQQEERDEQEKLKNKLLLDRGYHPENAFEDVLT